MQVISRYVHLERRGNTYWGCCPFHHEKDPSFAVHEDKQFYHCFGCKESGNVISFIEKIESVDFIDAVKLLAEEAKMELPEFKGGGGEYVTREKRDRLYSLMREAARHYHSNLMGERGAQAREYLYGRDLSDKLITRFGMGLSLDGGDVIRHLTSKGYTHAEMTEAGLIRQRAAEYYDVFYGRITIPIINNFGEVVAFGGRLVDKSSHMPSKYVNSTNTVIFDKSRTLYGINFVKKKKQRENIKYVIVTEGYMDVISLHKAGFDTAVASMSTALTAAHAKLIRNYTDRVYICYDGDSAGQTGTLRSLDILAAAGLNVKVVTIPDDLDPDDFIRSRGAAEYEKLLDCAQTLPAFKINDLLRRHDVTTPDGCAKYAIEAMKVVKALENPVEREEYIKVVQKNTGYPAEVLRRQADISDAPEPPPAPAPAEPQASAKRDKAEAFVIASILAGREYVDFSTDVYPYLTDETDRRIYEYGLEKFKAGERPSVSALYSEFDAAEIDELVNYDFMAGDDGAKFASCCARLKYGYLVREKERIAKEYDETKNAALVKEAVRIETALRALKNGGDNV